MFIARIGKYKIVWETGPIENAGYRVYEDAWQSHRNGKPIKAKKRRPREKFVSVHASEQEARDAIAELQQLKFDQEAVRAALAERLADGEDIPFSAFM